MVSLILSTFSCHILPSPFKNAAQDERCGDERAGDRARSLSKGGMGHSGKARPQPWVQAWAENTTCSRQEAALLQAVFKGVGKGCKKESSASWCCPALTQGVNLQGEQSATTPSLTATKILKTAYPWALMKSTSVTQFPRTKGFCKHSHHFYSL